MERANEKKDMVPGEERKIPTSSSDTAWQNKDITSKLFAEGLKEKSLQVYGIPAPRIKEVLPTNLPAVEMNELRLDNLFELEDRSYALIDYESSSRKKDKIKYIQYIGRVLKRLYQEGVRSPRIRMIVIYTSDVKKAEEELDAGSLRLKIEAGYLSGIRTEEVYEKIRRKAEAGKELEEEELMELVILPLTVKGKEKKREVLKRCVEVTEKLKEEQEKFALSGLITFTDKIIDKETAERIRRKIEMTKIGMLYEEEKREAVREAVKKAVEEKEREKEEAVKKAEEEKKEAVRKVIEEKQEELEEMRKAAEGNCKERNILRRLLHGKSVKETAEEFGVSEQKVIELMG